MYRYLLMLFIFGFYINVEAGVTVVVHSGSAALFDANGKPKASSKLEKGMTFQLPSNFQLKSDLNSALAFWTSQERANEVKTIKGKGTFAKIIVNNKEEWIDANQFYHLTLAQKSAASKTEAGAECDGIDCILKKTNPQVLHPAAAQSASHTKAALAKVPPQVKRTPSLNYPFEECYSFIAHDGSYGDYGKWAKEELQRYKHIWDTPFAAQIMSSGSMACKNFENLSDDSKMHFFIAITQDLSATESKCGHYYTSSAGINPFGSAIGLIQLDNDTARDRSVKGAPLVMDQKSIRAANATGVEDTCSPMEWPPGYQRKAMYLNGRPATVQSMHNPRANMRCGIGTLMRMIGEGHHPGYAGGFGPWKANKKDPNLPYKNARAIFSRHPLCQLGAK